MNQSPTNTRKAKCGHCKRILKAGEGTAHDMPWFGGRGNRYYLCSSCEEKQKLSEDPSGVTYE